MELMMKLFLFHDSVKFVEVGANLDDYKLCKDYYDEELQKLINDIRRRMTVMLSKMMMIIIMMKEVVVNYDGDIVKDGGDGHHDGGGGDKASN